MDERIKLVACTCCLLLYSSLRLTAAISLDITNKTCTSLPYIVGVLGSTSASYTLTWDGRMLPPGCRVGFNLTDPDTYELCVKLDEFDLEKCTFYMQYFDGPSTQVQKTIHCEYEVSHYCAKSSELYITFVTSRPTSARVSLTVAATVKSDKFVLITVGCGLSVVVFGAFFLTLVVFRAKSWQQRQSCLLWKCLDTCMPIKPRPSPTSSAPNMMDGQPYTISGSCGEREFIPQSSLFDPPPPYEPPPPSYEDVTNPKFRGWTFLQGYTNSDISIYVDYEGTNL